LIGPTSTSASSRAVTPSQVPRMATRVATRTPGSGCWQAALRSAHRAQRGLLIASFCCSPDFQVVPKPPNAFRAAGWANCSFPNRGAREWQAIPLERGACGRGRHPNQLTLRAANASFHKIRPLHVRVCPGKGIVPWACCLEMPSYKVDSHHKTAGATALFVAPPLGRKWLPVYRTDGKSSRVNRYLKHSAFCSY
jgi:hypothetical protein